ncbi:helix-turn-helix domain-containing protein [Brevibacillus agri]|uniref:helix-turn-helix domain-containing protein n=1 Tax=Brevibacillus agri TaxID=51101 RepID=UPI0002A51762|nr:helix-turn-helix domain-containing protein [Brevibacillus agri]ELK39077.1 DNA-binding protein [Brevibacillus agri BAB-2500]MDR9504718.1 helix-turn-helix domain-containing protein [Brevibacillus agri]
MNYAELLSQYIKASGLTLGEIVMKLNFKGISIDRSYISKLKNGSKPPASEEVTRALAEVTGGDPEPLIIAAYKEKAPPEVREMLLQTELNNNFFDHVVELSVDFMFDENGMKVESRETWEDVLRFKKIPIDNISEFYRNPDEAKRLLKQLPIEWKLDLLTVFINIIFSTKHGGLLKEKLINPFTSMEDDSFGKSLDELLQEKIDDPDDYFFLDGYLDASEEEKKRIRKYWYEIKKEMRENKVKATKPPSLFELTEDMDKGPNDE